MFVVGMVEGERHRAGGGGHVLEVVREKIRDVTAVVGFLGVVDVHEEEDVLPGHRLAVGPLVILQRDGGRRVTVRVGGIAGQ